MGVLCRGKWWNKRCPVMCMIVFLAMMSGPVPAGAAGETLTFGANVRLRYEFQDNFNQQFYGQNPAKGSSSDGFMLGRLRTGFDYTPSGRFHLALWLQDAEAWDMALADSDFFKAKFDQENNPNKDRWELWDSYLEIKNLFDVPLSVKAGRQRIFYGDKRVFGPGEWGNSGRWIWDAVKLSYQFSHGFVDAYYGRTQLHDPNEFSLNHRHGFESAGIYSQFKSPVKLIPIVLEPFFMTRMDDHDRYKGEDQRLGNLDSWYWGFRAFKKDLCGFDYDFTYIRQAGDYADDDIDACGYHALLGYTFKQVNLEPRISLEYSYASGDDDPTDGDHETFDAAFGARDKMYGRMNLFQWQNLKDAQANFEIKPLTWLYLKAEYHKFRLAEREDAWYLNAQAYRDKSGQSGDEVGRELDIVAVINLFPNHCIQTGFGHFRPDEFARAVASDKNSNWVFVQWEYKLSWKML